MTSTTAAAPRYPITGATVRATLDVDWDAPVEGLATDWADHDDLAVQHAAERAEVPATMAVPCPACSGPTIAADPARPEEVGFYCERCGTPRDADGNILL